MLAFCVGSVMEWLCYIVEPMMSIGFFVFIFTFSYCILNIRSFIEQRLTRVDKIVMWIMLVGLAVFVSCYLALEFIDFKS